MRKIIILLAVLVCFLCSCCVSDNNSCSSTDSVSSAVIESDFFADKEKAFVKRIVDGDTFVAIKEGKDVKIRLIGVDTPESVAKGDREYRNCEEGKIASDFLKELIENKTVFLEYDIETKDKYGRDLCYVYLDNKRMVNEILLEKGYAKIMTIEPNIKYGENFAKIEAISSKNKVGFFALEEFPWKY